MNRDSDLSMRAGRAILGIYICILFPVLSFWAPQGYTHLGNDKFLIYRFISVPFAVVLLPLVLIRLIFLLRGIIKSKAERPEPAAPGLWLLVPAFVYLIFLTVSFVLACDRSEALWGTVGWRMGFLTRLLFVFFFIAGILFRPSLSSATSSGQTLLTAVDGRDAMSSGTAISRRTTSTFPLMIFFPVVFLSAVPVLIFGILNRFSIYPLPYMGVDNSFISTMGNINWYGGYLVFVFAVALGGFICGESAVKRFFAAVLLLLSLASMVTQGSDGTTFAFVVGFIAACIGVCLIKESSGTRLILSIGFLGVILEAYGILSVIYPMSIVYADINLWLAPARFHVGLILIVLCVILVFMRRILRRLKGLILVASIAAMLLGAIALILVVVSAATPDTFVFTGDGGLFPWLQIDDSFGNDRGAIWRISGDFFRRLSALRRFFGVGPDCFATYAYIDPVISMELVTAFGTARLTNAHCEFFTLLINEGICGAVSMFVLYAVNWIDLFMTLRKSGRDADLKSATGGMPGIEASAIRTDRSSLRMGSFIALTALIAFCGISFPTVCSLPLLLLLLGLCA